MTLPRNDDPHGWDDLLSAGLLWYINTTCFHPHGFALAIVTDDRGKAVGWTMLGDGEEPIYFDASSGETDGKFAAMREFLDSLRPLE